jgi:cell division protein FtsB
MAASMAKKAKKKNIAQKMKKNKLSFIAICLIFIILALVSIRLYSNWNAIGKNREQIDSLNEEYKHRRIANEALQEKVDAPTDDAYIEDVANDNGYRNADEVMFYLSESD